MKPIIFVFSVLVPLLVGFLGSLVTAPAIDGWYQNINKPFFTPPGWLFAPVWTLLYIFMGVSLYLVLIKANPLPKAKFLLIFCLQLALNLLWSILFFGFTSPLLALIEIIILWYAILVLLNLAYKINRLSFIILLPYLLWVSFAAILNAAIVYLN